MPTSIAYLITFRALTKKMRGLCYEVYGDIPFDIHHPSESVFMIPPIGWDCE